MKTALAVASMALRALGAGAIVCLISWSLVECAPGDTAERAAVTRGALAPGDIQTSTTVQAELIAEVALDFDLHESPILRVPKRGLHAIRFDFGRSWRDGQSVSGRIVSTAGVITLVLSLAALAIAFLLAGIGAPRSARCPQSPGSQIATFASAVVLSLPIPWIAMLALDVFAYGHPLSIAPKGGMDSLVHSLLPIVVLAVAPTAVFWRHLRQEIRDAADAQWVVAARARGVDESRLWNRHLLKLALPTILALVPVMLAYLLAASIVVERVFAIDGLGSMAASAAQDGDAPVLIAFASLSAMLISATTQAMNRLSGVVDPRREVQS